MPQHLLCRFHGSTNQLFSPSVIPPSFAHHVLATIPTFPESRTLWNSSICSHPLPDQMSDLKTPSDYPTLLNEPTVNAKVAFDLECTDAFPSRLGARSCILHKHGHRIPTSTVANVDLDLHSLHPFRIDVICDPSLLIFQSAEG